MDRKLYRFFLLVVILSLALPGSALGGARVQAATPISFTILHTNDFHGQLEQYSGNSTSNPGLARTALTVAGVRAAKGAANVLLVDAGDEMQGSLLSNMQKGAPTIAAYNAMGYAAATFGNHEFDWGQTVLTDRTAQATYPYVTANIVAGDCSGWTPPAFAQPYTIKTVGTAPNQVKVGFIGVTTTETPVITLASSTAGLCFKDPAASILHYYDEIKAQADVIVVLSHLGFTDGGYGYGLPVYGDQTLADMLYKAGKPVPLIIGGHSHTNITLPAPVIDGVTTVAQAYYNGRQVGQADLTFDPSTKAVTVSWQKLAVNPSSVDYDVTVNNVITTYNNDPTYQTLINTPVGYAQVDLLRNYNGDSMMGDFIDDAIYQYLNNDTEPANDVDLFFNNAGGIRADFCDAPDPAHPGQYIWTSNAADCSVGVWAHDPMLLNYGQMFTILPFGNATVVGEMTGAQILQVLNQSATLGKGAIQPAGLRYKFYRYSDALPGPQPYAWGAFDACVIDKATEDCEPLVMDQTYKVGTNEFLAPAGGDNYGGFKYMTNITYWGDMLNAVDAWVASHYTFANPYKGPNGDGQLDGRITRDGTDSGGSIVPITILHNNDSHGNLAKGQYVGYTQLATLIKQERAHNPDRTLLLAGGDQIQGDAMMYYFKSAPSGFAADGTPLPAALQTHPIMAVMNALGYDAMTLGNHEFNFGNLIFDGIFKQALFPLLGANVTDSGAYGLATVGPGGEGVQPYIEKTVGPEGIKVAILGLSNHRVPNYELPSNIVGLTFSNPITTAAAEMPALRYSNDAVIALTHIGFTTNPKSVEVDTNVDTNLAAAVPGIDAIIGAHSHTNPANPEAPYKFLPTIVGGPDNAAVIINQAYRYNNTLGEVILGMRAKAGGGYEVVARAGQYITVTSSTPEDAALAAIVKPYADQLAAYNDKIVGTTTVPIDTMNAFTEETNGANLQADASVWELAQHGIPVDFHLSGAMTNKVIPAGTLKISDMFAGMPYENSLVVLNMNGPQLKAVLERAYRNYYFYKFVPGYGGYSHYTTCMIDINAIGKIMYNDGTSEPNGDNVHALVVNGQAIDFSDASKYYRVSTVNYLAAGSCNFNDGGVSLWPLDQIANDTQYYVRDAVIDYITAKGTVTPMIEGRLVFGDTQAPLITINAPTATTYLHPNFLTLDFSVVDAGSGVMSSTSELDGNPVVSGQVIDLYSLALGEHTLAIHAVDWYGNEANQSVTFSVTATVQSIMAGVNRFYQEGKISPAGTRNALIKTLTNIQDSLTKGNLNAFYGKVNDFVTWVASLSGKQIAADAANLLITDAQWLLTHPG